MIEFYPQIKLVHVSAVFASGTLFLLRGLAVQFGSARAMTAPLRYLSYTIDTVLLTAAMMLSSILRMYPFVHGWLTVKVVLLIVYVVLGTFALKRGRSARVRLASWLAALLVYGMMISVARSHDPYGVLAPLRVITDRIVGPLGGLAQTNRAAASPTRSLMSALDCCGPAANR